MVLETNCTGVKKYFQIVLYKSCAYRGLYTEIYSYVLYQCFGIHMQYYYVNSVAFTYHCLLFGTTVLWLNLGSVAPTNGQSGSCSTCVGGRCRCLNNPNRDQCSCWGEPEDINDVRISIQETKNVLPKIERI